MTDEKKPQYIQNTPPERGEYKGKALLILNPLGRYPFKLGRKKARWIVEHFDAIKQFADEPEEVA